ncbi:hypothetical protein PF010_g26215 [Phytophthora fragariae]|uniref:Uncharacterized protein n=1 Tax=Phytophthora fragariae TaxID=53985 RepID=A0A6A3QEM2_9STRA|nr:hypothetical protein PF003_g40743 [Phytophthora fragariae]KAE8972606.1 hypothetical protein PF011_g25576 [Phytophthora fragariae]KAE9070560.1 hypothetical protein PF010_g26215 [Phytophthora fragariae]KAE9074844.1 hypothetical protein PF007_g25247 [Phytophthora fragariae]KAE9176660.1 hypothetical protein PF004_g26004 [Phytophthora fragariae]
MSSGVGGPTRSPGRRTGPHVVALNVLTAASVVGVAARSEATQVAAGVPHIGCTPHLPSVRSQSPKNPLQHQAPRSETANDFKSLMGAKSGKPFSAGIDASTMRSKL